jgi:hypothetical protein
MLLYSLLNVLVQIANKMELQEKILSAKYCYWAISVPSVTVTESKSKAFPVTGRGGL